ncbi:MAG: FadR/GntR family transcriptional regulator [Nitrospinota bacterium]
MAMLFQAVRRTKVYEDVVRQLSRLIEEGRLRVGDQLPSERDLAQAFQVSRATVRAALQQLEAMGLVMSRVGHGTFVVGRSAEAFVGPLARLLQHERGGLNDLMEAREVLEPHLAALAAERATGEELERLRQILDRQEEAIARGESGVQMDTDFHLTIAEVGRNRVLLRLTYAILDLLRRSREAYLQTGGRPRRSLAGHRKILSCIERGDAAGARAAMGQHLREIGEAIAMAEGAEEQFALSASRPLMLADEPVRRRRRSGAGPRRKEREPGGADPLGGGPGAGVARR